MEFKIKGNSFFKSGFFQNALEEYEKALENTNTNENKERSVIYSNLSLTSYRLNNHFKALEFSNQSIKENPNFIKGYLRKIRCLNNMEKFRNAAKVIMKILEQNSLRKQNIGNVKVVIEKEMIVCKYFSHDFVIQKLPVYENIQYKNSIIIIDKKGRGHFKTFGDYFVNLAKTHNDNGSDVKERLSEMWNVETKNRDDLCVIYLEGKYEENGIQPPCRNLEIIGIGEVFLERERIGIRFPPALMKDHPSSFLTVSDNQGLIVRNITFDFLSNSSTSIDERIQEIVKEEGRQYGILDHMMKKFTEMSQNYKPTIESVILSTMSGKIIIDNCRFISPGEIAIVVGKADCNSIIKNCEFDNCEGGISLSLCKNFLVEDCRIGKMDKRGILVSHCKECIFNRNTFFKSGNNSIRFGNSEDCIVKNSKFRWGGITSLSVSHNSSNIFIKDCFFKETSDFKKKKKKKIRGGRGLAIYQSSSGIVKNCKFEKLQVGVWLALDGKAEVIGNSFSECKGILIFDNRDAEVKIDKNKFFKCETHIGFEKNIKRKPIVGGSNIRDIHFIEFDANKNSPESIQKLMKKSKYMNKVVNPKNKKNLKKNKVGVCGGCRKIQQKGMMPKFKFCGGCLEVYYCSRECQKKDWKKHKEFCMNEERIRDGDMKKVKKNAEFAEILKKQYNL